MQLESLPHSCIKNTFERGKRDEKGRPCQKISFVDVPEMNFLMLDGQGDPNTSEAFNPKSAVTPGNIQAGVRKNIYLRHLCKTFITE